MADIGARIDKSAISMASVQIFYRLPMASLKHIGRTWKDLLRCDINGDVRGLSLAELK